MKRYAGIDVLRGLAAFGIVGCHLNLPDSTAAGKAILHFCDMNVGVFGLISGFFAAMGMEEHPSVVAFAVKKAKRILPVYAVWTVAYLVFGALYDVASSGALEPKFKTLEFWASAVFKGGASCHLWYLIALFYCMILCAVLFMRLRRAKPLLSLSLSLAALALSTRHGNFYMYPVRLFAFVCAGLFLWECRAFLARVPVAVVILFAGLAFAASPAIGNWPHRFIPDYICGVALFAVAFACGKADGPFPRFMAGTSLCVYLVHPVVTAALGATLKRCLAGPYGAGIVAADWILSYAVSLCIAVAALRMPRLKRWVS